MRSPSSHSSRLIPCLPALGLLLGAAWTTLAHAADASAYATQGQCAGYPRVALTVPKGWCVGLVADARDGLLMPRRLIEVAPGRFWITDMGTWDAHRGRLLELNTTGQPGDKGRVRVLAKGLDRPHSPYAEALNAWNLQQRGVTEAIRQQFRTGVLECTAAHIKAATRTWLKNGKPSRAAFAGNTTQDLAGLTAVDLLALAS